jgi:hypothetical protein
VPVRNPHDAFLYDLSLAHAGEHTTLEILDQGAGEAVDERARALPCCPAPRFEIHWTGTCCPKLPRRILTARVRGYASTAHDHASHAAAIAETATVLSALQRRR